MKLGKNEKKILVIALKIHSRWKYDKMPEGVSMSILAKEIYGKFNVYEKGTVDNKLINSVKASLSRSLNNLRKKELIRKYRPIYNKV